MNDQPAETAPLPKKKGRKGPKHGFWRTNLEAFTVAIVMALVIKTYAFEAFQVPTESMEPTIIGRTPGGDRIIVNKSAYQVSDPDRYDIIVFRYPLSRLVNYVKRVVGLPGERIRIAHGDIYAAPDHGQDLVITRKPESVQDAIFLQNPVFPEEDMNRIETATFWNWWERPQSGATVDGKNNQLILDAGLSTTLVSTRTPITPLRRDTYSADRKGQQDRDVQNPIGDLRFDLRVTPDASAKAVLLRIVDGTQVNMPIQLEVAIRGSGSTTNLKHGGQLIGGPALAEVALEPEKSADIRLENVDDRIRVRVDGKEVALYDYVQAPTPKRHGQSQVDFGLTGGRAVFTRVRLYRDIYYTIYPRSPEEYEVPHGYYLPFGDNSPNSLDARGWKMVGIRLREDGRVLLGDLEAVSDDFDAPRQDNNPYFVKTAPDKIADESTHHFLDIQGNHWRLAPKSYDVLNLPAFLDDQTSSVDLLRKHQTFLAEPKSDQIAFEEVDTAKLKQLTVHLPHAFEPYAVLMHYVSRDEVMGRANLVFWPLGRVGVIR